MHYPTLLACPSGKRKTHHVGYFFCGHEQRLTRPESSLGMVQEGFKKRTTPGGPFRIILPCLQEKGPFVYRLLLAFLWSREASAQV